MVWKLSKGVICNSKKRTRTAAFLAAVLFTLSTVVQGATPFVDRAFAATNLSVSPSEHVPIEGGAPAAVSTADARGYEDLVFSFDYDSSKLDSTGGDNFEYGVRVDGGADQELGSVDGEANTGPNEVGDKSHSLLAVIDSQLEFYFKNNGDSATNDKIDITNIQLSGDAIAPDYTYGFTVSGDKAFIKDEAKEFSVTTTTDDPNGSNSPMVRAYFNDNGANGNYEYKDDSGTYQAFDGTTGFGPAEGFEFENDATTDFKATYATAGNYSANIQFRDVSDSSVVAEKNVPFTVTSPAISTPPLAAAKTSETVRPANLRFDGWYFYNDSTNTPSTETVPGQYDIVTDPANPSTGALKFSSPDKMTIATNLYAGTKLADIAQIGYSSYNTTDQNAKTFIQFNVSFDGSDGWQNRLSYIPPTSNGTWQQNEGVQNGDGLWQWSGMISGDATSWPDGDTNAYRSWNDIINSFPDAKIHDGQLGQLVVRSDPNSTNYLDRIYLATASANVNYDFEKAAAFDTTAPSVPELVFPANGQVLNAKDMYVDWSESTDDQTAPSNIVYQYRLYLENPETNPSANTRYAKDYTGSTRHPASGYAPGTPEDNYFWRVQAVDEAGNESGWSDVRDFVIDNTTPPKVTGIHIEQNGNDLGINPFTNDRRITVDWDDSDDTNFDHYEYQADRNKTAPYEFTTKVTSSERSGTIRDQDGAYNYRVRAIDSAGNVGAWSEWVSITLDRVNPVAEITSPREGTVSGMVSIEGTVTDANPMNTHFRISGPDGYNKTDTKRDGRASHKIDWDTSGLDDGEYTIYFATRDKAGNKDGSPNNLSGQSVDQVVVTVDSTKPSLTVTNPDGSTIQSGTVSVLGTSDDNGEVEKIEFRVLSDKCQTPAMFGPVTVTDYDGINFRYDFDTTQLVDGLYCFKVTSFDQSGNKRFKEIVVSIAQPVAGEDDEAPTDGSGTDSDAPADDTPSTNPDNAGNTGSNTGSNGRSTDGAGNAQDDSTAASQSGNNPFFVATTQSPITSFLQNAGVSSNVASATDSTQNEDTGVLAAETENDQRAESGFAEPASEDANDTLGEQNEEAGFLGGLALYWWPLIVVAAAALVWYIIGVFRRRRNEEA